MDVARVSGLGTCDALRGALSSPSIRDFGCVVVDTLTRIEEMVSTHVIRKGGKESLEDFGYGKGFTLAGEALGLILGDLDRLASAGMHVVCICHDSNYKIANPSGEDFLRWEPRLSNNGKIDSRSRFIEWADHLLALRYDIAVEDGKARGAGARTVYTAETADTRAKSRAEIPAHIPFASKEDDTLWRYVFGET